MENQNSLRDENCNGRGTKAPKRYIVQSRLLGERWSNIENARFAELQEALDYASMCSCYPVIYGMTRVVDIGGVGPVHVMQTFAAGEGQQRPSPSPYGLRVTMQLRYTISPAGETWGWFTKRFYSPAEALQFAKQQIFPRKICDAVRIYEGDQHLTTVFCPEAGHQTLRKYADDAKAEAERFRKHLDDASRIVANMPAWKRDCLRTSGNPQVSEPRKPVSNNGATCAKPCPHDTNGDGDCHRCATRNDVVDAMAYAAVTAAAARTRHTVPEYTEMGGREMDANKVRPWFEQWFRGRFNTDYNPKIDAHCLAFEAFRAAMGLRVLRRHQS